MSDINPYVLVIEFSLIIIISYLYNIVAKKTNIPSVLLLIATGIIIKLVSDFAGVKIFNLFPVLEILGIVGLIMIVLEAALDLELTKEKWPIIWKSFVIALVGLSGSMLIIGLILSFFLQSSFLVALLYAIPLSIISSAIVIPSVVNLDEFKHEFMVYESTFSDILGIMFFYFLLGEMEATSNTNFALTVASNVGITILVSLVASYALVFIFQQIKAKTKLFLLISVLILLYSVAKLMHLSSLLIILVFGLIINNHKLFFFGFLKKKLKEDALKENLLNFKLITLETAFVVRTFFFIVFGMTISLSSLVNWEVFVISILIIGFIYLIRFGSLRLIVGKNIKTLGFIAPRGLITILLFFSIPKSFQVESFDSGILLYVILISAILMTYSLIQNQKDEMAREEILKMNQIRSEKGLHDSLEDEVSDQEEETKKSHQRDKNADGSSSTNDMSID